MVKVVHITHDWWTAIVEIDESPETLKCMEEQLLFWSGGKQRIEREKGDIQKAYLKMLGQALINESQEWNIIGILSLYDEKEGWSDLRGNCGIKLISVDEWEFDRDDFDIEEYTK